MSRLIKHQLAWFMPLTVLTFGLTAPHSVAVALGFILLLALSVGLDAVASPDPSPPAALPAWPFNITIYGLCALHLINLGIILRMPGLGAGPLDLVIAAVLMGASSGYTAIVAAHELIHRPAPLHRLLGRLLLVTVHYEHFYTEHLRGHHVRVATADDPATARFDEAFHPFLLRTVPGQFGSAWALERRRVGARWWQSRVLHGLLAALTLAAAVGLLTGPVGLGLWLAQAAIGILLLEAVNYIEHWGLQRAGRRVTTVDSWDADSWFTYYSLIGLSRHADHHANPARPYPELRHFEESPKLPWGYFGTVVVTLFADSVARRRLRQELERRRLGPFASSEAATAG
jgi:alkane 1-monooxygenase